jgi:hypothetical protein
MKVYSLLFVGGILFLGFACGSKSSTDHSGHNMNTDGGPNQVLYNEVMDIHDEVMPATEDLYNISKKLKAQLQEATDDSVKLSLEERIRYVDSVNTMMMDWMRKFRPMPDTVNEERAREYYESELEKIKTVREAMLTALEKEGKSK